MTTTEKQTLIESLAIVKKAIAENLSQVPFLQFCKMEKELSEKLKLKV